MEKRLDALRRRFRSLGIANFIVTKFSDIHEREHSNIRYLCGFTGSNGVLLVTSKDAFLLTDGRYINQAHEQVHGAKVFSYPAAGSIGASFVAGLKKNKEIHFRGRVGFEVLNMYQSFKAVFPNSPLIETTDVIERISAVKEADELENHRGAARITDKVFESILPEIKPGVSENEISAEITYRHRKFGADKDSFEPIVASGPRSALPHGLASSRKIQKGDFVTLDIGCFYNGYASDMTRTVVVGKATDKQKKIYNLVLDAQVRAAEMVRPGVKCADIDSLARQIIKDGGHGEHFTHGLGHGVGMEVHARPRVNSGSKDILVPGMVVTIEPGIYLPEFGGVRIEDDVIVTEKGNEIINKSPKHLIEL
jgi:Xaa-Pro aminopeptidase